MTPGDLYYYEILISNYNSRFGQGSAEEIFCELILPLGFSGALKIFRKAKDRKINVTFASGMLDAVIIRYESPKILLTQPYP
jgi:hypothetical protein